MCTKIKLVKGSESNTSTDSIESTTISSINSNGTNWRSIYIIVFMCFLEALKIIMVAVNAWPYLKNLDESVSQKFFGIAKMAVTTSTLLSSFVTGWIANRIMATKPIILFGIILNILNYIFYANIEIFEFDTRKWAYLLSEICFGIGSGATLTWRAYIPMASIPTDRQRAFGLINVALNSGLVTSPFIVVPFGKMFTNSLNLPWGSNLSIFTAPVYIIAILNLFLVFLVVKFYDGKFNDANENEVENQKEKRSIEELVKNQNNLENGQISQSSQQNLTSSVEKNRIDFIAIFCCFLARFSVYTYYVYFISLSSSFTMATFGWDGKETMTYTTITQGILGTMGLLISIGFSTQFLSRLAPERFFILFSLAMMLLFYLLTFPWPFLTAKMPNCDPKMFSWCENTPAINVYVYNIALVGCLGLSLPIVFQNLDVLYSRLLDQIKQGVFQAAFHGIGEATQIIGSPLISFVYQNYGQTPIWTAYSTILISIIILWICNYRRLLVK